MPATATTRIACAACAVLFVRTILGILQSYSYTVGPQATIDFKYVRENQCASWVPEPRRNVLFVSALGLKNFTSNTSVKFMSGEFYATAAWDYTIRHHGFHVHEVLWEQFESMSVEDLEEKYHRIILGCVYHDWEGKCNRGDDPKKLMALATKLQPIKCRVGVFYWWDHEEDATPGFFGEDFFRPKQILTPFSWQDGNTFLGMFPHSVLNRKTLPPPERENVGLVLGKNGSYFDKEALGVIGALAQRNFTIHATCLSGNCRALRTIPGVINHKLLTPDKYAELIKKCAFMLGIGNPVISPSPIIALANGVAFLNPKRWDDRYQHPPLVKIGAPYVHNIPDFGNITDIVDKANAAVKNRFASYIPPDFDIENVSKRTCAMLRSAYLCN